MWYRLPTPAGEHARGFALRRRLVAESLSGDRNDGRDVKDLTVVPTTDLVPQETPRTRHFGRQRRQNDLTMRLIMALDERAIRRIQAAFRACDRNSINLAQFIELMMECAPSSLAAVDRPELVTAIIELFRSMDLDSNMDLEFDEFLATIITLGMTAATAGIGSDPIRSYDACGPALHLAGRYGRDPDRLVRFVGAPVDRVLLYEPLLGRCQLLHPSDLRRRPKFVGLDRRNIVAMETWTAVDEDRSGVRLATADVTAVTLWSSSVWLLGKEAAHKRVPTTQPQSALAWVACCSRLFSGSANGSLNVIDVDRATIEPFRDGGRNPHSDMITALEALSSLELVASASLDSVIKLWDVTTGTNTKTFHGHGKGVSTLAFGDEYKFLLSGGVDRQVNVWSPFADTVMCRLSGHAAAIVHVQFVPGSPQIVTADADGWLKIWDVRNFQCCQTFMSTAPLTSLAVCPAPYRRLVACSSADTVTSFGHDSGRLDESDPSRGTGRVSCAVFNPFTLTFFVAVRNRAQVTLSARVKGFSDFELRSGMAFADA